MEKDTLSLKFNAIKLNSKLQEIKKKEGFVVQSLLFPTKKYDINSAKKWAISHGYKTNKIDNKEMFIHLTQKIPKRFNTFKTIILNQGVKARVAGNMVSKFTGLMSIQGLSKFSEDIKSDMDITIPMQTEIKILCEGNNRDGMINRENLEESLDGWADIPIIDFHDLDKLNPTTHKISDRKGYTLSNPRLEVIEGKEWIIVPAEIINRELAYQLYLRTKRGKPLETSAEFGWNKYWLNGQLYQANIRPHLISIVDKGHIPGNKLTIMSS